MNTYLIFALLGFYSGYSAPTDPSVYKAIELSEGDPNYRCPYLRKSKLFNSIPNIVDYCPSLKQVQSLEKINEKDIDNGLCILFYNNFENLCYLTNYVSESVPIDIPNFFKDDDIKLICETLLKNTHFVNNSKPGIDAITHRLQSSCSRVCTDLDNKVKPICNLSALINNITAIFEKTNKETVAKPSILEMGRENNLDGVPAKLSNAKVPAQDISKSKINSPAAKNVPLQKSSNSNANIDPNVLNPNTYLIGTSDAQAKTNSIVKSEPVQQLDITVDIPPQSSNPLTKQKVQQAKDIDPNIVNTNPMSTNGGDDQAGKNSALGKHENTLATNKIKDDAKSSNANVQHQVILDINNQPKNANEDASNKNTDVETINRQLVPKASSIDVHLSEKDPISTSITKPSEQPNVKNDVISNMKENKVPEAGDVGNEGDMMQNTNDDFEMEEAIVPVDDGNPDDETVPKSSEVKSKTEVSKSTEKLKPLQTDERYTISANYQNQNVDDSDSYFFSYFMMFCIIFICAYVAYHNKQKILALVIEGRKGRRPSRSRRPNSANYHKLDSNLEEAVTSTCNKGTPQVIY